MLKIKQSTFSVIKLSSIWILILNFNKVERKNVTWDILHGNEKNDRPWTEELPWFALQHNYAIRNNNPKCVDRCSIRLEISRSMRSPAIPQLKSNTERYVVLLAATSGAAARTKEKKTRETSVEIVLKRCNRLDKEANREQKKKRSDVHSFNSSGQRRARLIVQTAKSLA